MLELGQKFFIVQQAGNHFGVAFGSGKRVVRSRLLWDATVQKDCVEIERGVLFDRVNRRSQSPLNHVHPRKAVAVDGAVGKRPGSVLGARCRRLQYVAVKRYILSGKRAVVRTFGKSGNL